MLNPEEGHNMATGAVTFRSAFMVWLRIGLINFGGPAGQIALMHKMLVKERKWLSESHFLSGGWLMLVFQN